MEKESHPFVSIIIPVRNSEKIIGKCMESLENLNYPRDKYEVIVSDSESTDKTPEIARLYNAKYISTPKRSVCAGRNEGFKISKGDLVAFSDDDCVMDNNWVSNSLKYFKDPSVGGVGGPNITPSNETDFGKAVGFVFNQAVFSAGSIYGRLLDKTREVISLPGCNMIFKREVLEKVMPVDETIYGGEDYAMNQAIRGFGYRLIYTPDTLVWHHRRPTPKKFFKQMYRYGISRVILAKKNHKWINPIHIIAGFGLPLLLFLSAASIYMNLTLFFGLVFVGVLFLFFYFFLAWVKIKSFRAAALVPYAIIILFSSWSSGFLRELLRPIKEGE